MKQRKRILLTSAAAIAVVSVGAIALFGPRGGQATAEGSPVVAVAANEAALLNVTLDAEGKAAFADGMITNSEYEAAVYAYVGCVRSHGIAITEPTWEGGRLNATASYKNRETAKPLIEACYDNHLRGIDVVASRGNR